MNSANEPGDAADAGSASRASSARARPRPNRPTAPDRAMNELASTPTQTIVYTLGSVFAYHPPLLPLCDAHLYNTFIRARPFSKTGAMRGRILLQRRNPKALPGRHVRRLHGLARRRVLRHVPRRQFLRRGNSSPESLRGGLLRGRRRGGVQCVSRKEGSRGGRREVQNFAELLRVNRLAVFASYVEYPSPCRVSRVPMHDMPRGRHFFLRKMSLSPAGGSSRLAKLLWRLGAAVGDSRGAKATALKKNATLALEPPPGVESQHTDLLRSPVTDTDLPYRPSTLVVQINEREIATLRLYVNGRCCVAAYLKYLN